MRFSGPEIAELLDHAALDDLARFLTRQGMGRLGRLGLEPPRRYERERPGELIHIDVKKLGPAITTSAERAGVIDGRSAAVLAATLLLPQAAALARANGGSTRAFG